MTLPDGSYRGGDTIRALVSGYPAYARAQKLLIPIQAYVDDSRSDFGDRHMVLAGYINRAPDWTNFSDAWHLELRRSPAIDYFKMREAYGLNGEFGGWKEEDRDHKVEDLARIIRHFKPVSIHAAVSQRLMDEIVRPVAPYGISKAYFYCFEALILPLAHDQAKQDRRMQVPIDFIFDEQEGEGLQAREIYRSIRKMQPPHVRDVLSVEPIFRDDRLVMPLQAADMLAWHIRRQLEDGIEKPHKPPDFLMADSAAHIAVVLTEERLRSIAEGLRKIPGADQLVGKGAWKSYRRKMRSEGLPLAVSSATFRRKQALKRLKEFFARFVRF